MDVRAATSELVPEFGRRDVALARELLGSHAENIELDAPVERRDHVGPGHPSAPHRLVDDDGAVRELARVPVARVDDPVLDDPDGRRPRVPEERIEVRDVHEDEISAVGGRMPHVGDAALGQRVLEVHGRDVAAGHPSAEPLADEIEELMGSLEDDDVDLGVGRLLLCDLDCRRWPVEGLRAAEPVRAAVREHRQQVLVRALDERVRIRAVDVPEEDPHSAAASRTGASCSSAATTSRGVTEARHGCPGTGQTRARVPAHPASWSPRSTCGTRQGRQRTAGTTGANSETTGVPTAAARCAGPVFPTTTASALASTSASSARLVSPPRSAALDEPTTSAVRARSSGDPVTTTRRPSSTSSSTSCACSSAGHPRAGTDVPGWTTVYGGSSGVSPGRSTARRPSSWGGSS